MFAFGLVVPALVLAFNGDAQGQRGLGGVHLNAEQQHGRELFSDSCDVCHTLAAAKAVGPHRARTSTCASARLSTAAGRKALVLNAILEGRARGLGQMPALLYQGKEAEDVADFRRRRRRALRRRAAAVRRLSAMPLGLGRSARVDPTAFGHPSIATATPID